MCTKERLIELMYDSFFSMVASRSCRRAHQYFGVKKAQDYIHRHEGGIIWHTQGSGKSIVMVLLAKWILRKQTERPRSNRDGP